MSRCLVVVVIAGLFAVEGRTRAADQPAAAPASVQGPLRFTLDPAAPAPDARTAALPVPGAHRELNAGGQGALAAEAALRGAKLALQAAKLVRRAEAAAVWNCGMPVVTPPAAVDPLFERKPTNAATIFHLQRASPPACGR